MLTNLFISNIVLIDSLSLDFEEGFSTFTGETGAGKSILLDAIALSMGTRGDLSLIRKGSEEASACSTFSMDAKHPVFKILENYNLIDNNDPTQIRLRRILHPKRSKAFVNDIPVGVSVLKEIGQEILEIHGQFDSLFNAAIHRDILDQLITDLNFQSTKEKINTIFEQWKATELKLKNLLHKKDSVAQQRILFQSIRTDLSSLEILDDEEMSLLEEREKIADFGSMAKSIQRVNTLFSEPNFIKEFHNVLSAIEKSDSIALNPLRAPLKTIESNVLEIDAVSSELLQETESVAQRLNEIDERLHTLRMMAKKYGVTTDYLPQLLQDAEQGLTEDLDAEIIFCEKEIEGLKEKYTTQADILSVFRQKQAEILSKNVESELSFLQLKQARFNVHIKKLDLSQATVNGLDQVEFQIAANKGQDFAPLTKAASGGEASRIMLAIKAIISTSVNLGTIIFDEIETGVGGSTATAIGERLKNLSNHTQVLSITHSPQVAAKSDQHYLVQKEHQEHATKTSIAILTTQQRLDEVARMLSGAVITEASLSAAKDLFTANTLSA